MALVRHDTNSLPPGSTLRKYCQCRHGANCAMLLLPRGRCASMSNGQFNGRLPSRCWSPKEAYVRLRLSVNDLRITARVFLRVTLLASGPVEFGHLGNDRAPSRTSGLARLHSHASLRCGDRPTIMVSSPASLDSVIP